LPGQYTIESYKKNELVSLKANPDYRGFLGKPANDGANIKYYADSNNLKLDVQQGNIDVAGRSLTATDAADLEKDSKVKVHKGPGGELRYIVFNFDTMPFGAKTADADAKKALAVRQAMADIVDREAIATQVYKGTYLPAFSVVPDGLPGASATPQGDVRRRQRQAQTWTRPRRRSPTPASPAPSTSSCSTTRTTTASPPAMNTP
jgi:peptide/nickel transport system substrate-binding protein